VHALVAGDGPCRPAARALATELGVADRVHWLGRVDHAGKLRLLAASDAFAFPSTENTEAFGIAQLEAMAAGVPVVASDLPTGVTEVAMHGRTAVLAPPGDPPALAAGLIRLLADRALARRLARRARSRVARDYALAAAARRVEAVLLAAAGPNG
jgi:rhamnosyl/mannosyltransferase